MLLDLRYVRNFFTLNYGYNFKIMKNVLISVGGNCESNVLDLKINFDEIIAVDSGIEHLNKFSLMPTVLIGDFDSISKDDYQSAVDNNIPIKTYQKNKDATDFELSLQNIKNPHDKNIIIIGGEGGEIDHLLSIFSIISNIDFYENVTWLYEKETILFKNDISLQIEKNKKFSLIPLTEVKSLNIDGAKWNLKNKDVDSAQSLTLRNETTENILKISCQKGKFVLIY